MTFIACINVSFFQIYKLEFFKLVRYAQSYERKCFGFLGGLISFEPFILNGSRGEKSLKTKKEKKQNDEAKKCFFLSELFEFFKLVRYAQKLRDEIFKGLISFKPLYFERIPRREEP